MIPILREVRWRSLLPGQLAQLCVADASTGSVRVVQQSADSVFEAPNWSPDGESLVFNAAGSLFRTRADGADSPQRIDLGALGDINNDHVISPDGTTVFVSSEGDGHIYAAPFLGGEPTRISEERAGPFGYFVIGISPDGGTLAFTGADKRAGRDFVSNVYTMPAVGGPGIPLTDADVDSVGGAYSADGKWLYFNSELGSTRPGHAQVHRMRPDGGDMERLTSDDHVNWFPKPSPDGSRVVYLSFPPGTIGHEANVPVRIRMMNTDGSDQRTLFEFLGGQGTMNVSSWSPDGAQFAFVAYPQGETQWH